MTGVRLPPSPPFESDIVKKELKERACTKAMDDCGHTVVGCHEGSPSMWLSACSAGLTLAEVDPNGPGLR